MPTADIKPKANFFIEQGNFTQNSNQCFGPVLGDEITEFRVTSKFSCNTSSIAYSICKGVVLIQPQTGSSTKVNLVLRPYDQPFPGLNIKFFVYRGLKKSDFFSNDIEPLVIPVVANVTSDFINKVNADFDSFYSETLHDENGAVIPKPSFLAKYINYDPALSETTLLTDFFFKKSQFVTTGGVTQESHAYELPLIEEGQTLGFFEDGECGIDIVLDYGDYKDEFDNGEFVFNLNYVRLSEAKIIPVGTDLEKKLQREQVTQFIDIAAFYGLYVDHGIINSHLNNIISAKEGIVIYTDLLMPFATRNNWYIYIQGDRTRSYNYYGNYTISDSNTNNLKLGVTENALVEGEYQTSSWPILLNIQQQAPADERNKLYLQLVTDNNDNVMLYGQLGSIENAQQNNFSNVEDLKYQPDPESGYSNLTKPIVLSIPADIDGNNITGVSILLFQGVKYKFVSDQVLDDNDQPVDVYAQPNFFDDVFSLVKSQSLLQSGTDPGISKMTSQKLNLINHYFNKKQEGISAVQILRVNDIIATEDTNDPELGRVTYITETVNLMNNAVSVTGTITSDTKTSGLSASFISTNKTYVLPPPFYYELETFTESMDVTIKGLILKATDGSTPAKIILGITEDENNQLKDLITADKHNPRLFLIDMFSNDNFFISSENINYQKYRLGVVAEQNEKLELLMPATDIFIYSIDGKYHFSELYSKYMKEYKTIFDNPIINTVE